MVKIKFKIFVILCFSVVNRKGTPFGCRKLKKGYCKLQSVTFLSYLTIQ